MSHDDRYLAEKLNKNLVGFTFTRAVVQKIEGEEELVLHFKKKDGKKIVTTEIAIWGDAEGNGPGWVSMPRDW